jgi:hypothetical protein
MDFVLSENTLSSVIAIAIVWSIFIFGDRVVTFFVLWSMNKCDKDINEMWKDRR